MIDTDYIHLPRGVQRRAKLGAGHSESNNTDYIKYYIYIFRGDVNKLINIISEAKLIKTFDDKDRLIVDKFVLFKNDTDKGIVIANKDLYATEVVDIGED